MIKSFKNKATEDVFNREFVKRYEAIARTAFKRLRTLDSARSLEELAAIQSFRLEKLKGDRKGDYSIRINKQWRLCFRWSGENAYDVEIVDYH